MQAPQPPVFFVIGPVGHGKSTVREILCKLTYLKGASCSDVIYKFLSLQRNVSVESLRQEPKEALRPALIEAGDWLVGHSETLTGARNAELESTIYRIPSILIRTLYMNGNNIIDGVRRRAELIEAKDRLVWNGIKSIIIHVSDPRKPEVADNSENLLDLADEIIVNDGGVEELERKIRALGPKYFGAEFEVATPMPVVDFTPDAPEKK